jgi:hypothetical protein
MYQKLFRHDPVFSLFYLKVRAVCAVKGENRMSIKKELLAELTEKQLKAFAEHKGIIFSLSNAQRKYYEGWNEKDKLVDLMSDKEDVTIKDIEEYLKASKNSIKR